MGHDNEVITIHLRRNDIVRIITPMTPPIEVIGHPLIKGSIDGSYGRWSWNLDFKRLTNLELVTILALITG